MADEKSPLDLGALLNRNISERQRREMLKIREEGFREGLLHQRKETLDWLERAYINDPGRPDRGSPKAEAILQVAKDMSEYFNKVVKTRGGRR